MHLTYVHRSHEPGGHLPHIPPVFFRYLSRMFLPDDVVVATRRTDMLLEDKNAVIYGGGGVIGGAVARAFAREGATVHLAGRTLSTLEEVADGIRDAGGRPRRRGWTPSTSIRSRSTPGRWSTPAEALISPSTSYPTLTTWAHPRARDGLRRLRGAGHAAPSRHVDHLAGRR